jgi:DNA-binding response OmpR family regulator
MRVLVVEDEAVLADAIARGLRREAMAVDIAPDGHAALERIAVNRYDVMVLDRDLPGLHGDDVCRRITSALDPPDPDFVAPLILMLTASGDLDDRVDGLTIGADDYLSKPFAFAELVARIRALGRRSRPAVPPVIVRRGVTVDSARRVASRDGLFLRLTNKELAVLEVLLAADGAVVSAEELLERAWDEHADPFTNAVRVTMVKLRRKLGNPPLVETVAGAGYRIP